MAQQGAAGTGGGRRDGHESCSYQTQSGRPSKRLGDRECPVKLTRGGDIGSAVP